VRQMIQENNAVLSGNPLCLSLSESTGVNPGPLSIVLKEADTNMYREKRGQDAFLEGIVLSRAQVILKWDSGGRRRKEHYVFSLPQVAEAKTTR
jgi:hypothetical protein